MKFDNKPDHQVVKQEQVQGPTVDHLVHIVKPLSFYQKLDDFAPQKQLPTILIHLIAKRYKIAKYMRKKERRKLKKSFHTRISPSEGSFCKQWLRAPYSLNCAPFLLADAKSLATADSGASFSCQKDKYTELADA